MTRNWVNIGSGNGLLPDGTKPLPEPILTYHQRALSLEDLKISISKITFLESHSDLPGANEFKGGMDTHTVVHVNDSRVTCAADKLSQNFFNMNTLQMTEIE